MSHRQKVDVSKTEVESQQQYIEKIKNIIKTYEKKPKAAIVTYGCAMNAHDSEKLIGMLEQMGYEVMEDDKEVDLIIYNTCCVRENAENRVYGNLGFLKKMKEKNKNLKIILCGCMMQQDAVLETIKNSYRHVDVIFGTYNIYRFPELLHTSFETKSMIIDVWKEHGEIVEDLPTKREYSYKSSVNIMYGCNNFCTYCIVPYVRGRERSRKLEDILSEIKRLVETGVIEVTLLGQNVNSYGNDLDESITFPKLLRKINEIDGLERIRFMTSHPKDLTKDLVMAIKECDKVCNHIHLPFQSGSTEILKKMNRRYSKDEYLNLIKMIKEEIPDVTLTSDIIVGFPGEREKDFEDTIDVVKQVEFIQLFTFIYSKRDGTPAANLVDQVEETVAKARFQKLMAEINPIALKLNQNKIGTREKVLVENVSKYDDELMTGRTEGNILVHFKGSDDLIGKIVEVDITDCKTFYLVGNVCL